MTIVHRIVAFLGTQAKREQQLVEQQQAKDAAAKQRHQDEADSAATAAAHIQAQMKVPFYVIYGMGCRPIVPQNKLERALGLRYGHNTTLHVYKDEKTPEPRIFYVAWHCNIQNRIIKIGIRSWRHDCTLATFWGVSDSQCRVILSTQSKP